MAKELPYFKFTAQEWQNGDISLESYELKGLFVDICSYYWIKDCSLSIDLLNKKFKNDIKLVNDIIKFGIIKQNEDDSITIKFLDEQFDLLSEKRKKRAEAGRIGGLKKASNTKILLKQKANTKGKAKNKKNYKTTLLSELKSSDFQDENNIKYFKITIAFYDLFKKNLIDLGSNTTQIEKTKGLWIDSIRFLIEIDEQSIEDIKIVYAFLQEDMFWKKNILSTSKLREKFNKLLIRAKNKENGKQTNKKGASHESIGEILGRKFRHLPKE